MHLRINTEIAHNSKESLPKFAKLVHFLFSKTWDPSLSEQTLIKRLDDNNTKTLLSFIEQVLFHSKVELSVVILSLKYTQRLRDFKIRTDAYNASNLTFRDQGMLFLLSIMLAHKFTNDVPYNQKSWAILSGLSKLELSRAEMAYLKMIDYSLSVSPSDFTDFCTDIHNLTSTWKQALAQKPKLVISIPTPISATPSSALPLQTPISNIFTRMKRKLDVINDPTVDLISPNTAVSPAKKTLDSGFSEEYYQIQQV
jgi:hypothetical protein